MSETDTIYNFIEKPEGHMIAFYYTMSLDGGRELDTNRGGEPMVFLSGTGELLPSLEEELLKLKSGESATIILTPDRAFGPVLDEELREFPMSAIPEEARHIGRQIMARGPDGEERQLEIVGIRGDKVVIDFNHELAGQTLRFDVEVVTNEPCR